MARNKTSGKGATKKAPVKKPPVQKTARAPASAKAAARKPAAPPKAVAKPAPKTVSAAKAEKKPAVVAKKPALQSAPVAKAATKPVQAAVAAKAPVAAPAKPAGPQAVAKAPVVPAAVAARPQAPAAARAMPAAMPKPPGQTITSAPATPKALAEKAAAARQQAANKKPINQRHGFKTAEWIVYPAHGVGRIVGIEEQEIAGISLELFVITFEKDKMTLRVPTGKSQSVGMRKLAEEPTVKRAMETLKGKARIKRTMWSRRAQEYEAKINSGDLIAIAEVVRDLYRSESQPEQSYSERQLYEAALDRMAREIAAVERLDERGAVQRITEVLSKSAKGRRLAAEEAEVKAA